MEINLTKDQLAIVADRLTKVKTLEFEAKSEKTRLDDFILGIITTNGVVGSASWEIKEGKLFIQENKE